MSRPSTILFRPILSRPTPIMAMRYASSSASSSIPSQSRTSTSSAPLPLPWPEYLGLRKQRRLWSSITTIPTTFLGLFLGGSYFASLESDPSQLIMGIEAIYVYGGATLGCMALGYLTGPTVGSSLFSATHRSISAGKNSPLEIMDREFYNRIKRNRADPTLQSAQNISPDFYGEKVR
uniref:Presequence translocated-associated motor subunit PAM17 n=1 Tax=Kwoniella bestiolae CBS 10118 TaxID=1296100 RepID=A0A1B9FUJ1_9TREE|nr:presequence translocated-associated motor subunit PAM17, mitochondrial [Kwoniella bestiolae CBS 10118]OCF22435.1 presequence translocated-associated motor subunit PAM17, mitochondrial [Kwoniella bestiolae CBS 10118]